MAGPNYNPPTTKTDPMGASYTTGIADNAKSTLARCPFCQSVSTLQAYNFDCTYMPSMDRDPNSFVFKGCSGECPECDRFVRVKDVTQLPGMGAGQC